MASNSEKLSAAVRPSRHLLANAIRALAMDAVERANSGHPGMPMGMADIAEVLWNDFLRFSPSHPDWSNRDRFVCSNGHGSMLLYAVSHLTGYPLAIEELKAFRQMGSRTAGHPEREVEIGIETTTGPLGQGSRTRSEWRLRKERWRAHLTVTVMKLSIIILMPFWATVA